MLKMYLVRIFFFASLVIVFYFPSTTFATNGRCIYLFESLSEPSIAKAYEHLLNSEKLTNGLPNREAYLKINEESQIREYTRDGKKELRLEKLVLIGQHPRTELAALSTSFGRDNLKAYDLGGGRVEVYRWVAIEKIFLDNKTNLIRSDDQIMHDALVKIVPSYGKKKDSAMMFVDLDSLTLINYLPRGHGVGDRYISMVIEVIKENLRMGERRGSIDVGFRHGGDEFFFLLLNIKKRDFKKIQERIYDSFRNDPRVQNIINEALRDYQKFLDYLSGFRNHRELEQETSILEFLHKSEIWANLSVKQKKIVETKPKVFRSFIREFVASQEIQLRSERMSSILLGGSLSFVTIKSNDSFVSLLNRADQRMQLEKMRRKAEHAQNLPEYLRKIDKTMLFIPEIKDFQ